MIKMMPLDMSWFLLESKVIPVHGAFLYVFSPPAGAAPDYARKLLRTMKRRAVGAPFNLRPQWKAGTLPHWEKVDVDLSRHVFESKLPAPGTEQQLLAAAAELAAPALAWDAPLWRVHWLEGLEGGRFAFLFVAHHSQWDGMSIFRLMGEMMTESDQTKTIRAPWQGVSTWLRLASPDTANARTDRPGRPVQAGKSVNMLRGVVGTAKGLGKVFLRQGLQALGGKRRLALPLAAPETRPDRDGSSARSYGLAKFPVARIKAVAQATEATFNDVMSSVVDGAYSRYLDEIGLAASKPLVALVPMAIKIPGAGNQLSGAIVPLGEPASTPLERLAGVREAMLAAKADIGSLDSAGAKLYAMIGMGIAAMPDLLRIGEQLPVTANMLISNPFGLPKVLYLGGSRLDYFVPLMGPSLGTRLMFGIYSYGEDTYVSITSLRSVVSDMDRLSELVYESFEALAAQVLPTRPKRAAPRQVRRPRTARSTTKKPKAAARKRS